MNLSELFLKETVLKQLSESRYYNMPMEKDNVEKRMVKNVETIDGNMNVFDAANKFLQSRRRRFPIVQNGKLIGQISQKRHLKSCYETKRSKLEIGL